MYKKIGEYGIIGNLQTIALVGLDGSIDWLCYPYLDSQSVFAALLDYKKGGLCQVTPEAREEIWDSVQNYIPRTNVLVTKFRTRSGVISLTDFMSLPQLSQEAEGLEGYEQTVVYRKIEMEKGQMQVRIDFVPRFDYAQTETELSYLPDGGVIAFGAGMELSLTSNRPLELTGNKAEAVWSLKERDVAWMRIGSSGPGGSCSSQDKVCVNSNQSDQALEETITFWQDWLSRSETGCKFAYGKYKDMIERSALVLKLLHYQPSGAIAAAATTSLPEEIGGSRNWDYRYTWIRDASFTLQALYNLGHLSETEGYLHWLEHVLDEEGAASMQIMYGMRGERDLTEKELLHLDGYKGSRPVRIGNAAARQRQLDIYGEIMDAVLRLSNYVGKIRQEHWPVLRDICDYVVKHWQEPDAGIWEVRGGPFHFVYSKVMCWVALDRGLTIADRYGFPCDRESWENAMQKIKEEILEKGYNQKQKAFVQHYGTDDLDAANLLIPVLGFLPFDDPRMLSTIEAIQQELSQDGLVYRYKGEDDLNGQEGAFLICSFWLVDCLISLGRLAEAENLLNRLEKTSNHLGLFAEEFDPVWQEPLGNFPQAFTHIGYINSVMNLLRAREKANLSKDRPIGKFGFKAYSYLGISDFLTKKLLPRELVLNQGQPSQEVSEGEIADKLKQTMNLLRGAYFDKDKGRVAYENMPGSELYDTYVDMSKNLNHFDPDQLETKEALIAFWINLYNVMVIHGVVELRIRNSVKEVRRFFKRIKYMVGNRLYSLEDIEHGILRANKRPPNSFRKCFGPSDPRLAQSLKPHQFDPRIHFGLVCASTSCPPIALYTADNLDQELTQAGRTFCNSGNVIVDCRANEVILSRIFSWYASDFGRSMPDRLRYLADFLYNMEEKTCLKEQAENMEVRFKKYDWRLNRE